ncbi:MAG: phosphoribosyltransferase [Methanosarcinales archaeon]|nr:phosphoribosyltransferase [Methanosarcinales archaeon]
MEMGSDYTKKDQFRCQLITWGGALRMSRQLANIINKSGYKPDIIVAVGRGGYVPARIVCDYLRFRDLTSIRIEHWGVAATLEREAHIKFGLSTDISGLKVLLVDDITDTGDTLLAAQNYLSKHNPASVRTAVLQHKTCSTFAPDFFVHRIIKWRWIIYPWAAFEDISGFIKRVMRDKYVNTNEIQQNLNRDFQLLVSFSDLTQILEQMTISGLLKKKERGGESLWKKQDL